MTIHNPILDSFCEIVQVSKGTPTRHALALVSRKGTLLQRHMYQHHENPVAASRIYDL